MTCGGNSPVEPGYAQLHQDAGPWLVPTHLTWAGAGQSGFSAMPDQATLGYRHHSASLAVALLLSLMQGLQNS